MPITSSTTGLSCAVEIFRRQTEVPENFLVRDAFADALAEPLFRPFDCPALLLGLRLIVDRRYGQLTRNGIENRFQ
jgi:hypothetical protein